ncbi:hypothetical protein [Mucilaginibacter glaciei]|uniref:Uncharacterized protein n=1 Tax=Mucilaginibacter glaciei TaxID=2772109 RepID=A0A926NXV9_9SPHI|nr:hypothetical protein [Mucilaginibacter glaciei]MBD1393853.1 hypothetical protein [Mucilaginibacter glaciei]
MDLQTEKLDLLQTIINSDDAGLISDLKALVDTRRIDWFDELSPDNQSDILEGIAQADAGNTVPHSEAVKLFGKWGLK